MIKLVNATYNKRLEIFKKDFNIFRINEFYISKIYDKSELNELPVFKINLPFKKNKLKENILFNHKKHCVDLSELKKGKNLTLAELKELNLHQIHSL